LCSLQGTINSFKKMISEKKGAFCVNFQVLLMNSILGAPAFRRLLCHRDGGAPRSSLLVGNTMGGLDAEGVHSIIEQTK
jgi:hypothetical protein